MNSGGLPPESQEVKSIVSRPCMSASVANGSTVFLPLWSKVELKRLSITSAIGRGMPRRSLPHSSWFMNPPPTAFKFGHQVADDQVQGQRLVELLFAAGLAEVQPLADVPVDPAAQAGELPSCRRRPC